MAAQKKTAEVDYSMQEKILALYELQKIDSKIDEINKIKGELPLEVQDLEDELAGLNTRIEHINGEIEELNALTKQRKREVDQAKILIGNYKEQQNNVRNNREFDALPRRSSIRSSKSNWPKSVSKSTRPLSRPRRRCWKRPKGSSPTGKPIWR